VEFKTGLCLSTKNYELSCVRYVILKNGPLALIFVHVSKTDPYILHMLYRNSVCWQQIKYFFLSVNLLLREVRFTS